MRRDRRLLAAGGAAVLLLTPLLLLVTPAEGASGPCSSPTIKGTDRADKLVGTKRRDVILARGGADTIVGRGGNDVICAGSGADVVRGDGGADRLFGDGGVDTLAGGPGADAVDGGGGHDTVTGSGGPDTLLGGSGYDVLRDTSTGTDLLTGGSGLDLCTKTSGDEVDCDHGLDDGVFLMPFERAPTPGDLPLAMATRLLKVDLYTLVDRSGSMQQEASTLKTNLAAVVNDLKCPPIGSGDVQSCVDDLWAGAGTVGYSGSGVAAYQNWVDVQPSPNFASLPVTEPVGSNTQEALVYAAHATVTGQGGAAFGMSSVPPRSTCGGSPAANAGYAAYGYPCLRTGALPLVVMATDEGPMTGGDTHHLPSWASVVAPAYQARGARLLGLLGSAAEAATSTDLRQMAIHTGAVDAANGNTPLVADGSGAASATALGNLVRTALRGLPLNLTVSLDDDPSDAVDASAFVDRVEVLATGSAECTAGLETSDTDADGFADSYVGAVPGTPLCWRVVVRTNTAVPATGATPQSYPLTLSVRADEVTLVDQRSLTFVVPPA